jgi:uncharacterized protein (DUF2147 family)
LLYNAAMLIGPILVLAVQASVANDSTPASIQGMWQSPGGNSIISIAPCGPYLSGTVAWASDKAKRDSAKATSQLVGTQLLTQLEERKPGRWQGKLFIPDKNMRVSAKIQLTGQQQLKVSGCVAGKALCKSELWARTSGPPNAAN